MYERNTPRYNNKREQNIEKNPSKLIEIFKKLNQEQKLSLTTIIRQKQNVKTKIQCKKPQFVAQMAMNIQSKKDTPEIQQLSKNEQSQIQTKNIQDSDFYYCLLQSLDLQNKEQNKFIQYENKLMKNGLQLKNLRLKSISDFSYKELFEEVIQFSSFRRIIITKQSRQQMNYDVFKIFSQAQESKIEELVLKLPIYCEFFTQVSHVNFPNLQTLNLGVSNIISIQALSWMFIPNLTTLNLQWNFITKMDSLVKMSFQKYYFDELSINNNYLHDLSKLSRIGIKKLKSLKTDNIVSSIDKMKDELNSRNSFPQSEDISFVTKIPFELQCLRTIHKNRIAQKPVSDSFYRMNHRLWICKIPV